MFEDNYNQTSNAAKQNFKSQRDSILSMCDLLSHKKGFIYLKDEIMVIWVHAIWINKEYEHSHFANNKLMGF